MSASRRAFLAATLGSTVPVRAAARLPNIIIVLADDLGFGDVACFNPLSKIRTPRIDEMARQGVRFTDAHTPCGVCSPTRYGLLTGRYPWRSELKRSVLWPWDKPLLEADRLTLPALLKKRGYSTACIGKWHLGWNWKTTDGSRINDKLAIGDPNREVRDAFARKIVFEAPIADGPTARGFDYYFGDDVPNFPPYAFIENDRLLAQPTVPKPDGMFGWPGAMTPGWKLEDVMPEITSRAARYIRSHAGQPRPFFLYVPFTSPHTPIAPSDEFAGTSSVGRYGDYVQQTDAALGQILDAVTESGQAEDTIVFFTSDNGPENLTYPLLQEYSHASQGPWRGAKRMLWEGGNRVPFVAWGPGRIAQGRTSTEIICLTDLFATLARMTGATVPESAGEDSYDIGPVLFGGKRLAKPLREATVYHSINDEYALRQGDWVYIESETGAHGAGEPAWWRERFDIEKQTSPGQLFNLRADPRERHNLLQAEPGRARRMRTLLHRYKMANRSAPRI